jgi:hypothetical protein
VVGPVRGGEPRDAQKELSLRAREEREIRTSVSPTDPLLDIQYPQPCLLIPAILRSLAGAGNPK